MALTAAELKIVNMAMACLGEAQISSVSSTNTAAVAATLMYDQGRDEMLDTGDDWFFLRARAELDMLYLLTVDSSPAPEAWAADAALTGATSGATCTVVQAISDTVYLVTKPSDDFTDGEVISDGTNSVDCAADYPEVEEAAPNAGGYLYIYKLPTNFIRPLAMIDENGDEIEYDHREEVHIDAGDNETDVLLCNQTECFLKYLRKRTTTTCWPAWFTKLVYLNIARQLAIRITGDNRQKGNLIQEWWNDALVLAREANAARDADTDGAGRNLDHGNNDVLEAADYGQTRELPPGLE